MNYKPKEKPIVFEKRTLTYKSENREFLYEGNQNDVIINSMASLHPGEKFKVFNTMGKEIFDSEEEMRYKIN